jgi:hypothetical protein
MLIYHPAFDINHARLRILQLVEYSNLKDIPFDLLRILDFYMLFPHLLADVKLSRGMTRAKRLLAARANKYNRVPAPKVLIRQMEGIHETAVRALEASGVIELPLYDVVVIRRSALPVPDELTKIINDQPPEEQELAKLLATEVASIPLNGPDGLKARTGLLEYRYDPE